MGLPILTLLKYASALKEIPEILNGLGHAVKTIKKAIDPNGKGGRAITVEEFEELSNRIDFILEKVENMAKVFK